MSSLDAGVKFKGLSLEGEYYWRWLSDYEGSAVSAIPDINDHGYQLQASAMVVPKIVQVYFGNSGIYGQYGDQWEGTRRPQLVSGEAARVPGQHRVDSRGSLARRVHRVPDARRCERQHLSRQSRVELLRDQVGEGKELSYG